VTGGVLPATRSPIEPFSVSPHAGPTTYPRLLRILRWAWWQAPTGMLVLLGSTFWLLLAAYGVFAGLGATVAPDLGRAFEEDAAVSDPPVLLALNLTIAVGGVAAVLAVVGGHQERPGWVVSVVGRARWCLLLRCALVAVATVTTSVVAAWALAAAGLVRDGSVGEPTAAGGRPVVPLLLVIALTTPLQATGEEVLFRGYLTQAIAAYGRSERVGPLVAAGVVTALFVAAHVPADLWVALDLTVFALVASWVSWRTGGLEAAVALHVVNNLVALGLAAIAGTLDSAFADTPLPWPVAAVDVATLLAYAVLVHWWAGRRAQRRAGEQRVLAAAGRID